MFKFNNEDTRTTPLALRVVSAISIMFKKLMQKNCQKQPPEVFYEKRCSSKICKIHGKATVAESPFIRKETLAQVFSCEFCKISKNTFFTEHLRATASGLHVT